MSRYVSRCAWRVLLSLRLGSGRKKCTSALSHCSPYSLFGVLLNVLLFVLLGRSTLHSTQRSILLSTQRSSPYSPLYFPPSTLLSTPPSIRSDADSSRIASTAALALNQSATAFSQLIFSQRTLCFFVVFLLFAFCQAFGVDPFRIITRARLSAIRLCVWSAKCVHWSRRAGFSSRVSLR